MLTSLSSTHQLGALTSSKQTFRMGGLEADRMTEGRETAVLKMASALSKQIGQDHKPIFQSTMTATRLCLDVFTHSTFCACAVFMSLRPSHETENNHDHLAERHYPAGVCNAAAVCSL